MEIDQTSQAPTFDVQFDSDEMIINMGPQHPSTHGVLRLELKTDGEIVKEVRPHIGYLHRCFEKHAENVSYGHVIPYTDRLDYIASMNMNWAYVLGVERLMGVEVPDRVEYIRIMMAELNRLASHLIAFGSTGMDLGAFTPFLYAIREREMILDIFEEVSGARLLYNYIRIGGVAADLTPRSIDMMRRFLDWFEPKIKEYNDLLSTNKIFIKRTARVGVCSQELALSYGLTGPNLRATGIEWDLRKQEPYGLYPRFDFNVVTGKGEMGKQGDCWDRYIVRIREMVESCKIIRQALETLPEGNVLEKVPKVIRVPAGEIYTRTEAPRGESGFYIVSDGGPKPYRIKMRSPCFVGISILHELCRGVMIADVVAILSSIDFMMGECDR